MLTLPLLGLLLTEGIVGHYDKFLDVTIKQLESATTLVTLLLGAIAYLATKRLLEVPPGTRPRLFWVMLPSAFAIAALALTQWSYVHIENSLLMKSPEDFGVWWQPARLVLLACLILSASSLAVSFIAFSRR